jgi:hypothetical protein
LDDSLRRSYPLARERWETMSRRIALHLDEFINADSMDSIRLIN